MLSELRVRELGVIADLDLVLEPGFTVITGETGAGKTLIVEALELLLGGRADAEMVRAGAEEALVEGRFVGDAETILARAVPRSGRSRASVDGRMAPAAALEEVGRDLVDLYGQHVHQSLLRPATQRGALDHFAGIDLAPLRASRARVAGLRTDLDALGGDDRARRRELDLLRFELEEIERAQITSAGEDDQLALEEETLASVVALREASATALSSLDDEDEGALDRVGAAIASLEHHDLLGTHRERLRGLAAEMADAASELRRAAEALEEDPRRLAEVRERRHLLHGLVRKHGDSLAEVLEVATAAKARIAELDSSEERRAALASTLALASAELADEERAVGDARRRASAPLAKAVQRRLGELGLTRGRLEVRVPDEGLGDEVEFLFGANPGEATLALAKVASGGELARAMLALRLVLTRAPDTLVFDEVDAGIGGEAALAVGRALAELAGAHQVLVVTHLAQVAAHADHQVVVEKREEDGRTLASARSVEGDERVVELSRMLSGHPDSQAAQRHANELLVGARRAR